MKIVHSLWTKPWYKKYGVLGIKNGFPSATHYWGSWALSALTAKQNYGKIELVTDDIGKNILVDRLEIPYDSVKLELNNLDDIPLQLWAFGKLIAFMIQDEPFWHIDNDAFLLKKLPQEYENAQVISQVREQGDARWYTYYVSQFIDRMPVRIDGWDAYRNDQKAYCMGIFGGTNLSAIRDYAKQAIDVVRNPANAEMWKEIVSHQGRIWRANVVIEQQSAYCYFADKGVPVDTLARPQDKDQIARGHELGFTHMMKRRAEQEQSQKMLARLQKDFPETYQKVIEMTQSDTLSEPKPRADTRADCGCNRNRG